MPRLGTVAKPLLLEFRNAWSRQIRALYSLQFMTKCPKSLHCLQSLSFLPHLLNVQAPWPILDVQTVEFSLLCAEVLKYRLEKNKTAVLRSEI